MAHLANNGSMWTEGNKGALGSAATIFIVGNFYGGGVSSVPAAIGVSGAYDCLFAFQNMVSGGGNLRALIRVANAGGISSVEGPVTEYTDDAVFFATYDGTSSLSLFRNGVDISSARANTAASGAMANEMNNFSLGGVNRGTDAYGQPGQRTYLAGFWNRVLRSDERLELSRKPLATLRPALPPNLGRPERSILAPHSQRIHLQTRHADRYRLAASGDGELAWLLPFTGLSRPTPLRRLATFRSPQDRTEQGLLRSRQEARRTPQAGRMTRPRQSAGCRLARSTSSAG